MLIESNAFYQIIYSGETALEQKSDLVMQELSKPQAGWAFSDFVSYVSSERTAFMKAVAKQEEPLALKDGDLLKAMREEGENYRTTYAVLIEGARSAPKGVVADGIMSHLTSAFTDAAGCALRLKTMENAHAKEKTERINSVTVDAPVSVRSKPFTLLTKPGSPA